MVKPVALCGSEAWRVTELDTKRLNTWKKKMLRNVYGPVVEQGIWRIRNNQELRELYKDLDIAADIKKEKTGIVRTSSKNGLWKGS
jgi:hypothetical protein